MSLKDWEKKRFKDIVEVNPSESLPIGQQAKYIPMEYLIPYTRKVSGYELRDFKGGTKFKNKDVIFARITPCLENGKAAYVNVLDDDEIAFGSTEYI